VGVVVEPEFEPVEGVELPPPHPATIRAAVKARPKETLRMMDLLSGGLASGLVAW
jgi:hypothetical protein